MISASSAIRSKNSMGAVMNTKRAFSLAGAAVLAGGLLAGSTSLALAQEHPSGGRDSTAAHGPGHANQQDHDDPGHQAAVAEALGLTVEELQAEFEAGKTVPQIAEERDVDLADLHETITSQRDTNGG
jgi:hypothetical protein